MYTSRRSRYSYRKGSRGYVIPGTKYCGPGNSVRRGKPGSPLDWACYIHDRAYTALAARGYNPYVDYNYADAALLKVAANDYTPAGRAAYYYFNAKRQAMKAGLIKYIDRTSQVPSKKRFFEKDINDERSLKKSKGEDQIDMSDFMDIDCNPGNSKRIRALKEKPQVVIADSNFISGKTKFKVSGPVSFWNKKRYGSWIPVQSHVVSDYFRLTSSANSQAHAIKDIVDIVTLSSNLFNPRYITQVAKDPGGVTSRGPTLNYLNSIDGANTVHSIFAGGATNFTQLAVNYATWQQNAATPGTGAPSTIARQFYQFLGSIFVTTEYTLHCRNNGTKPCVVKVYDFLSKQDEQVSQNSSNELENSLGYDFISSESVAQWTPETNAAPTELAIPASGGAAIDLLEFQVEKLHGGGYTNSAWKNLKRGYVELAPGESANIKFERKRFGGDINAIQDRLAKLGKAANSDPALTQKLCSLDRKLLIIIKGIVAHDASNNVGISASEVDCVLKTKFKWSLKANEWLTKPSSYEAFAVAGAPTITTEPFAYTNP